MKLIRSVLAEGITHIEDLPIDDFINAVETLKDRKVTEKLDGSNLWFGIDSKGFFTSREGKSSRGKRFYSVEDYPLVASYNGFRGAHVALERHKEIINRHLNDGDMVEIEVLFGRQPNTVTYGNEEKNFIVILRGIETDQKKVDSLAKALDGKDSKVQSTVITSEDGEQLKQEPVEQHWSFTQVKPVDIQQVDTQAAHDKLVELKNYLKQPNKKVMGKTNKEVAEISLNKVPKEQRDAVKAEREAQLDYILKTFKQPIKEILLDRLVRKVKPFLQSKDLDPSEDIGVEGVVASDKKGNMIKIVDKDVFTAINTFNNQIRNTIAGLVRTDDQDAPLELRGGAFGQAKIRIAELLGVRELALSSSSRKILMKFKGADAAETARNIADNMQVTSFGSTREKVSAILRNSLEEIDGILDSFKQNAGSYKLKIEKTGKEIGISPEVMKRTLTAFAETKRDINEVNKAVLKSRELPELIMALYGRTIQGLFSGDSEVKESKEEVCKVCGRKKSEHNVRHIFQPKVEVKEQSFSMLKTFEEDGGVAVGGDGGDVAPAPAPCEPKMATTSGAIAPYAKKLMGGRMVTRRPRKFIKKKKFAKAAKVAEGKSLLQVLEFQMAVDQQFAKDVDDTVGAQNDVEFKQLRNQMKASGDQVTSQDVTNYLDKAHELNDEVDTVTFGMEIDDGSVVKVYVNQNQADEFEKALADKLGEEDDIETVIDELANTFDIVDVEWPEGMGQTGDAPVATDAPAPETDAGLELPNGEDGQIDLSSDEEDGDVSADPIIDLSSDEVAGGAGEEGEEGAAPSGDASSSSLMKDIDSQASQLGGEEEEDTQATDGEGGPDLGLLDGGDEEQSGAEEAPASTDDGEEEAPAGGEEEAPAGGEDDGEESSSAPDLGDIEAPEDEEQTDVEDDSSNDDDTPPSGGGGGGKKKKKPNKDEESDTTNPTKTEESTSMSFGQRFKEKLLAEAAKKGDKKPEDKKKKEEKAAEEEHAFSPALQKLMREFPTKGTKMMIALMNTLGVPLDAMNMKKAELKKSVEAAGEQYMKDSQMRMWVKRVIDGVNEASASGKTVAAEGLDQELNNAQQKLVLAILYKIGFIESIEKIARAGVRNGIKKVASLAQADSKLRTSLKVFAEQLGIDAVTAGEIKEAKNHLGEPEQTTFAGWKRACKAALAKVDGLPSSSKAALIPWLEGDEDIAEMFIGAKPFVKGKTFSIGQWEGDKGSVYNVQDAVDRLKKVAEAVEVDPSLQGWIDTVKKVAVHLGVPEWSFNYKASQVDMAIRQHANKVKNRPQVQRRLEQLMTILGEEVVSEESVASDKRASEIISRVSDKLKELGVKSASRIAVRSFLEGGGAMPTGFIDELCDKLGYDDGATSYRENQAFWKKVGLSKFDYQNFVNRSI